MLAALFAAVAVAAPPQHFLLTLAKDIHGRVPPHVVLVDRSGKVVRSIGTAGYDLVVGEWSPNRQTIAWSDPQGIHVENADGTNARLLLAHPATGQPSFIWSPDGSGLDVGGVGPKLLYVPIDGAPPSPLLPTQPGSSPVPSFWTPGRRALVWAVDVGCCSFTVRETVASTHVTHVLYRGPAQGGQAPLWSPDATQRIMFTETKNPKDDYDLTLVDEKTGKKRLLPVTGSTTFTAWSPDGRTVAAVLHGDRVVEITLATGRVRAIGRGLQVFYGRDGTLYVTRDTYSEVWTSRNGSPERFLFRAPGGLEVYSIDED